MIDQTFNWLLEIDALDPSDDPVTLRFSQSHYRAAQPYIARLEQPALFSRFAQGLAIPALGRPGVGEAVLSNADRALNYLEGYAMDGRQALSKRVSSNGVKLVARATVDVPLFQGDRIVLNLRSAYDLLERPHPHAVYAGTNVLPAGVEGTTDDLAGQMKPICLGKVRSARCVQVNTAIGVWQVHEGGDCAIVAVRDRDDALTDDGEEASLAALLASSPAAGHYTRFEGYFKASVLPSGAFSADVDCDAHLAGDVFELLATEAGFTVVAGAVTALNAIGSIGHQVVQPTPTAELLSAITRSGNGFWSTSALDEISAGILAAPSMPTITIREGQIITPPRRSAIGAGPNGLPFWRVLVNADPVEFVQDDTGNPRDAARYRTSIAESASTRTRHPLAGELVLDTWLRTLVQADALSPVALALYAATRHTVEITGAINDATIEQLVDGTVVKVIDTRLGYDAGRDMIVLGLTTNGRRNRATLHLWG